MQYHAYWKYTRSQLGTPCYKGQKCWSQWCLL